MKVLAALFIALALILSACSAPVRLPDGVSCTPDELSTIHDVPDKANPDSKSYDSMYAEGWYLGHGCDTSKMAFPTLPPINFGTPPPVGQ